MKFWKDLSISKKLYFVVGIMAVLIASELLTLRAAMHYLSAVRAFVGGESLWSKAQKNAAFSLQRYGLTRKEEDYQNFLNYLRVPEGDHQARLELGLSNPDMGRVSAGFRQGGIQPDDIGPMVDLLHRFGWEKHLARAVGVWTDADGVLERFKAAGENYHRYMQGGLSNRNPRVQAVLSQISTLNLTLTRLEEDFSAALGEGSRFVESVVITLLCLAVLMVESIGLTLTFRTSRQISRGLANLNEAANKIGYGEFGYILNVTSNDELGTLAAAMNQMSRLLEKSYKQLEVRVTERTAELARAAAENEKLYNEAREAVRMREEFLSIASHELKTPLTALSLQLQVLERKVAAAILTGPEAEKLKDLARAAFLQTRRLARLSAELMDLTQLKVGKFKIKREHRDLAAIVCEVAAQLSREAARAGSLVEIHAPAPLFGDFDPVRMEQVVTNLISNAIKYGNQSPIEVIAIAREDQAILQVRDHGIGIPTEKLTTIFERYERAVTDSRISGLGLGLYIAKQIVVAHSGEITVESEVGKGSTFTVRLPRFAPVSQAEVPAFPEQNPRL